MATSQASSPELLNRQPWPPLALRKAMMSGGRDTWIAELLGIQRTYVAQYRAILGIPAFGRGGSMTERNDERIRFKRQWAPHWRELGLKQEPRIF